MVQVRSARPSVAASLTAATLPIPQILLIRDPSALSDSEPVCSSGYLPVLTQPGARATLACRRYAKPLLRVFCEFGGVFLVSLLLSASKSLTINLTGGGPSPRGQHAKVATLNVVLGRARNPRWEPGMGMIPDPRQIGDGDGDGPPIPGKSGIGDGDDPRLSACAEQLHLMGSRMSPRLASKSVTVITRGRRVRRRHNDIRFRFRMVMLSAGLMLQCQLT